MVQPVHLRQHTRTARARKSANMVSIIIYIIIIGIIIIIIIIILLLLYYCYHIIVIMLLLSLVLLLLSSLLLLLLLLLKHPVNYGCAPPSRSGRLRPVHLLRVLIKQLRIIQYHIM